MPPYIEHFLEQTRHATFWSSLASIILIDLVLAGDNAIVIAMAARTLPKPLRRRAIFWGAFGAIVVRASMTAAVLHLLKLKGLMLIGGLVLLPIAWRLLHQNNAPARHVRSAQHLWDAVLTIVVADALMGLDNVLAIAGASSGHFGLVVIGLLISVPLVVWGSTLLLKLIARHPVIVYLGAATIAWTAARMVCGDQLTRSWFHAHHLWLYIVHFVFVAGIVALGWWTARTQRRKQARQT